MIAAPARPPAAGPGTILPAQAGPVEVNTMSTAINALGRSVGSLMFTSLAVVWARGRVTISFAAPKGLHLRRPKRRAQKRPVLADHSHLPKPVLSAPTQLVRQSMLLEEVYEISFFLSSCHAEIG